MKTIVVALFIGIMSQFDALSQNNNFVMNFDTLTFSYRTGGAIDTFDLPFSFPISTTPGGVFGNFNSAPTIDLLRNSPTLFLNQIPKISDKWIRSALPHIGFFYSFGTKGTQFIHANFQQSFRKNSLINIEINRNSSRGMGRQSEFSNQNLQVGYRFDSKRIIGQIKSVYSQNSHALNGGISNDSSWLSQGLEFAPVLKENANSFQRFFNSAASLKFNFITDTTTFRYGIITKHNFTIWNRVYNEINDTLFKLYPVINIDSDTTRDQFQDAKLKNSIGLFAENNFFSLEVLGSHRYWRFQNLGTNNANNEFSTEMITGFHLKKINVISTNLLNIKGANNEFSSKSSVKYGSGNKYISGNLILESLLPELVQRFYYSNNLYYSIPVEKQQRLDFAVCGSFSIWKIDANLTMGTLSWKNNLIWKNVSWLNGVESVMKINYLKVKLHFDFNWLQAYPELQINSGNKYLPKTILSGRILVKKKIFAAKKLAILLALDPQLTAKYTLMAYNTLLDNWYFSDNNGVGGQLFSLHSTFALQIDEFKFFIRAENFQDFWADRNTEIAENYYTAGFLLRFGISWDFFN